ncbi:MAG: glutaredoxin family protein [Gammaproteobacteria bacterium]|nr:MAG: glutaredoxin family protein [Gammaproteobacteria bacterium]
MPELVVYSRRGCHLCEDLLAELEPLLRGQADLRVVDIDSDPRLAAAWGTRIPVVMGGGDLLCEARLDRAALFAWLRGCRASRPGDR